MHHVEQWESCRFPGSYMVSPKCVMGHNWPLSDISMAGFCNWLSNHSMLLLDNSIHTWVVGWYSDLSGAIVVCKVCWCCREHHTIVCDNFFDGSPLAQDIFKYEHCEGLASFYMKCTPLGPCSQQTMHLDDVPISGSWGHNHCVNVCFVEQGCWGWGSWWDAHFGGLVNLVLVTGGGWYGSWCLVQALATTSSPGWCEGLSRILYGPACHALHKLLFHIAVVVEPVDVALVHVTSIVGHCVRWMALLASEAIHVHL